MGLVLLRLWLVAGVAAQAGATDGGVKLAELEARLDALHARRDDPAALAEARRLADAGVAAAPGDYAVLWRAARERFTESDLPTRSDDARSRLGKEAYDLAERAIAANPNAVEGQYWAALSIGSYAQGMGVLRALANGIEGKFTRPLERATALDIRYDHGSIPVVWAAYYLELPWPKRDRAKAAAELERALQINPANLRARLYQARLASDEGHPERARALLAAIASARVGAYDPPEERRVKIEAAKMAATLH
ncbi:MAG TPA: tetratricopeptide repeat protein [Polyangia bacterium]|nr:tetratricopeptide repeat protein [Polyangia bacterium]